MRKTWPRGPRRTRLVALLAAAAALTALAVAGCTPSRAAAGPGAGSSPAPAGASDGASAIPVGSSSYSLTVDGRARTYIVYRPPTLPSAAPLVVMMHGGFGTGSQAEKSYRWNGAADAGHFLVAYPDGLNRAWNTDGGGCCGIPAKAGVDDTAFITAMVHAIEQATGVDTRRVYATGISNGGIMAYTLACQTRLFAAIGPDSATQLAPCPGPARTSVIAVHGTADTRIPYNGGPGQGAGHIDGPSVPSVNAGWRRVDGCGQPAVTTAGAVTTSAASCPGGRSVVLVTIAGAGHQWPGSVPNPVAQRLLGTDPPSTALDATAVIWKFFAAHPA
jgi:polyhydroxybutyrate depolymerase